MLQSDTCGLRFNDDAVADADDCVKRALTEQFEDKPSNYFLTLTCFDVRSAWKDKAIKMKPKSVKLFLIYFMSISCKKLLNHPFYNAFQRCSRSLLCYKIYIIFFILLYDKCFIHTLLSTIFFN